MATQERVTYRKSELAVDNVNSLPRWPSRERDCRAAERPGRPMGMGRVNAGLARSAKNVTPAVTLVNFDVDVRAHVLNRTPKQLLVM